MSSRRKRMCDYVTEIAERRTHPRLSLTSLICVKLDDINGGIVFNIAQDGLALSAARNLLGDNLLRMLIQFPDSEDWIEAKGKVIWRGASRKEAGVQFVDLTEGARRRIKEWIASQECEGLASATRPPLESSSVEDRSSMAATDAKDAAPGLGHNRDVTSEPNEVASEAKKEASPASRDQGTQEGARPPGVHSERRLRPRRTVLLFTYAEFGGDNGGLVFNLGEGGFAVTAGEVLRADSFPKLRVRFPDAEDWIEAGGRVAWLSESGKSAGIEFVNLSEEVQARIRKWASTELAAIEQQEKGSERQDPVPELPSSEKDDVLLREWVKSGPFVEDTELVSVSVPAQVAAPKTEGVDQASREALTEPRAAEKPADEEAPRRYLGREPSPNRRRQIVFSSLAAVVSVAIGLTITGRTVSKHEQMKTNEGVQKRAEAGSSRGIASVGRPVNSPPQTRNGPAGAVPEKSATAERRAAVGRDQRARFRSDTNARTPAVTETHAQRANQGISETRQEARALPEPTADVPTGPVEEKTRQIDGALPTQSAEGRAASLLSPARLPATAQPSKPTQLSELTRGPGKETPIVPANGLEAAPAKLASISISSDPYPSIRIPKRLGSKKSGEGKNLQLGQLVSKVEPAYPEEAKQRGIEGIVKAHTVINREGAVQDIVSVSGDPSLVPAATRAIRQWKFSRTLIDGRAVETEEDVTIVFRLVSAAGSKN